jgi:hypothetical protein
MLIYKFQGRSGVALKSPDTVSAKSITVGSRESPFLTARTERQAHGFVGVEPLTVTDSAEYMCDFNNSFEKEQCGFIPENRVFDSNCCNHAVKMSNSHLIRENCLEPSLKDQFSDSQSNTRGLCAKNAFHRECDCEHAIRVSCPARILVSRDFPIVLATHTETIISHYAVLPLVRSTFTI